MARSADQEKVLEAIRLSKLGMKPPAIADEMTKDGRWGKVNVRSVGRWVKGSSEKKSSEDLPPRVRARDDKKSDRIGQNRTESVRIMSDKVTDIPTPEAIVESLVWSCRRMELIIDDALRALEEEKAAEDGDPSRIRYEISNHVKSYVRVQHELAVATGVADGILAKPPTVADMSDSIADLVNAVKGVRQ